MVCSLLKLAFDPKPYSCTRFSSENPRLNRVDVEHTACFESGKKPAITAIIASKRSVLLARAIAFSSSTSSKAVGLRGVEAAADRHAVRTGVSRPSTRA